MKLSPGFLFIQLVVSIALIGILSGIMYQGGSSYFGRKRDSQRITDVDNIKLSLEAYYEKNNAYPPPCNPSPCTADSIYTSDGTQPWIPDLTANYLKVLPKDPKQAGLTTFLAFFGNLGPKNWANSLAKINNFFGGSPIPQAQAAQTISYIASSSVCGNTTPQSINVPAGTQNNDVMLMIINEKDVTSISDPAGWTQVDFEADNTALTTAIYYKVANNEPASYSMTGLTAHSHCVGISTFRGTDTANPINDSNNSENAASTNITIQNVSPTVADTEIVALIGSSDDNTISSPSETNPTFTERLDGVLTALGTDNAISIASGYKNNIGTTGNRTATQSGSDVSNSFMVALRPPAPAPTVTSVSATTNPQTTAGNIAITINGSSFVATPTVTIGGTGATVTNTTATTITATAPAKAAGSYNVVVTNPDTKTGSCTSCMTYTAPPSGIAVNPNSNINTNGTTPVTVTGTGLIGTNGSGVKVDPLGTPASASTTGNSTSMTFTAPTRAAAGSVTLRIYGTSGTDANGIFYNYVPFIYGTGAPAPTSVTGQNPQVADNPTGYSITINGSSFVATPTVTIGGTGATVTNTTATTITATAPAKAAGSYNVVVTNPDLQTGTCSGCMTYTAPPSITSVTPNSNLSTAGGQTVTIKGTGVKTGPQGVKVDTTSFRDVTPSGLDFTFTTPGHTAGNATLKIYGTSGTDANGIFYTYPPGLTFAAPGPPTVETLEPNKTQTSATLNGRANPNNLATTAWFRWGPNNLSCVNLPNIIPASPSPLGSGSEFVDIPSQIITGLSPSTTYYFCAVATNSANTTYGSVIPFTTSAPGTGDIYVYWVSANRQTYQIWAALENTKDLPQNRCQDSPPLAVIALGPYDTKGFCGSF